MSSSRLSFRPRPLDIHKKLPVIKSVKEFEDEDMHTPHRVKIFRLSAEIDNEAHNSNLKKKLDLDIPTPQFVDVESYVRDYLPNFKQPTSYLRGKGARTEFGEYCEYDLDNEDDDWLHELNRERRILAPEKFESLLFKLEVLDHKARERAGVIAPTLGSPVYILLQFDSALEALQAQSITYGVFQAIFNYWKEKRDRWQKPILRRLQPPPPLTDTNPYNVFRPREKAHRLHTRRMQRRENNAHSFDKLRQVRRNLEQAKTVLEALIKREEKKRDVMESEVSLQRIQIMYKHESELLEDSLALPGFPSAPCNFGSSEEEYVDSDDVSYVTPHSHPAAVQNQPFADIKPIILSTGRLKREFSRRQVPNGWLHKLDPLEPVLLFTKPLDLEKLSEAGISPPLESSTKTNDGYVSSCKFRGRMGRGGRIVFDRWNALMNTPIDCGDSFYVPPKPRSTIYN